MPLFFKRKKYEDRNKLMVESHVVENLTTKYFARRLECKSQMAGCCLYKGIVYRADSGFAQNGMEYFFNQGFRQRDVAIEWDTFTGRKARDTQEVLVYQPPTTTPSRKSGELKTFTLSTCLTTQWLWMSTIVPSANWTICIKWMPTNAKSMSLIVSILK
ncbi:hypothetical protein B6A42_18050 [Vibrio coralliilyticus]|nr:hypothetical protein B6A42_18050 [Vibrio coralliilyticus]